jgi:hypothetical protein
MKILTRQATAERNLSPLGLSPVICVCDAVFEFGVGGRGIGRVMIC